MRHETTLDGSYHSAGGGEASVEVAWGLTVVWCEDPSHVGEALVVPPGRRTAVSFGRETEDDGTTALLVRQRPGRNVLASPLDNPRLSRRQLQLVGDASGLRVANVGKRPVLVNGRPIGGEGEIVRAGDTVEIAGLVLFLCVRRAAMYRASTSLDASKVPFGGPDAHGIVGESEAAWELRERIAFFAGRDAAHVLVTGASGSGKELVAQALHALSPRGGRRLVSRNAATIPHGIIDAELFGNVANYPNAGMPERTGIIGEAHESTLFLDEFGELPIDSQAHLLRVLDENGEYQRLGDARRRRADIRVIAATNRDPSELKSDLLARLTLRLEVPSLNERREDIPLVARHLLRRITLRDPQMAARFGKDPVMSSELSRALVQHVYTTQVRELDALLWRALSESRGTVIDLPPTLASQLVPFTSRDAPPSREPREVSAEAIRAALAKHAGVRERVWRELDLPSRHALHRLMKKYGIADDGDEG